VLLLLVVLIVVGVIYLLVPRKTEAPAWGELKAEYAGVDYTSCARTVKQREAGTPNQFIIEYPGEDNDVVKGLLILPDAAESPVPLILLAHGLGGSKEEIIQSFAPEVLKRGMAVFALDLPLHGERSLANVNLYDNLNVRRAMFYGVREWLIAVEWLSTHEQIDSARIALLGYSLGSMIGVITAALQPGVSALALCVGGESILPRVSRLPRRLRRLAWPISPSLFAGQIAPRPVLMLNGLRDETVLPAHAELLWQSLGEPREIQWYASGHHLPDIAGEHAVQWLYTQVTGGSQPPASPSCE
jgi:fermentation-respiration switch protein FrsA (DUF1100 family)